MRDGDDDPFAGGIELELDPMEARRERAEVVPKTDIPEAPPAYVVGQSEGGLKHSSRPPAAGAPPAVPGLSEALAPPSAPKAPKPPGGDYTYKPLESDGREPPSLLRTLLLGVAFLALAGGFLAFWYRHKLFPPKPADVVAQISQGPNGEIVFNGETFTGTLDPDAEVEGTVNQVASSYWPQMPFITHEVVLVTGDYADPDSVTISELTDHSVAAQSEIASPEGDMWLVHLVPADATALEQLMRVQKGQYVVFLGDLVSGTLTNADGSVSLQTVGTSKVFRVSEVLWEDGPPPPKPIKPK